MDDTQMPKPLRRAVHQRVSEAVMNCQEVLRYTEPGSRAAAQPARRIGTGQNSRAF